MNETNIDDACRRWVTGLAEIFTRAETDAAILAWATDGRQYPKPPAWGEAWAPQLLTLRAGLLRHLAANPDRVKGARVELWRARAVEIDSWGFWLRLYRAAAGCGFGQQDETRRDWTRLTHAWSNLLQAVHS